MLVGARGPAAASARRHPQAVVGRGELQVIGTTLDSIASISSGAALERRFQPILVEPSIEETVESARGEARYEEHHKLLISDEALTAHQPRYAGSFMPTGD